MEHWETGGLEVKCQKLFVLKQSRTQISWYHGQIMEKFFIPQWTYQWGGSRGFRPPTFWKWTIYKQIDIGHVIWKCDAICWPSLFFFSATPDVPLIGTPASTFISYISSGEVAWLQHWMLNAMRWDGDIHLQFCSCMCVSVIVNRVCWKSHSLVNFTVTQVLIGCDWTINCIARDNHNLVKTNQHCQTDCVLLTGNTCFTALNKLAVLVTQVKHFSRSPHQAHNSAELNVGA